MNSTIGAATFSRSNITTFYGSRHVKEQRIYINNIPHTVQTADNMVDTTAYKVSPTIAICSSVFLHILIYRRERTLFRNWISARLCPEESHIDTFLCKATDNNNKRLGQNHRHRTSEIIHFIVENGETAIRCVNIILGESERCQFLSERVDCRSRVTQCGRVRTSIDLCLHRNTVSNVRTTVGSHAEEEFLQIERLCGFVEEDEILVLRHGDTVFRFWINLHFHCVAATESIASIRELCRIESCILQIHMEQRCSN